MKNTLPLCLGVLVSLSTVAACGPKLTMQGAQVKVGEAAALTANCQPISAVEAEGPCPGKAEIVLRNKAGEMNASQVVISNTVKNEGSVLLKGTAYKCAQP